METEITLEKLLENAIGDPEMGAVNFNYLHEVLRRVLKQLGMLTEMATINELDRIKRQSESNLGTDVDGRKSIIGIENENEKKISVQDTQIDKDNVSDNASVEMIIKTSNSNNSNEVEKKMSAIGQPNYSEKEIRQIVSSASTKDNDRIPSRKESRLSTENMLEQLHFNQRIEANETALDKINILLEKLVEDVKKTKKRIESNNSKNEEETKALSNNDVKELGDKITNLTNSFEKQKKLAKDYANKSELKELCSTDLVQELIEEQIAHVNVKLNDAMQNVLKNEVQTTSEVSEPPKILPTVKSSILAQRKDSTVRINHDALNKIKEISNEQGNIMEDLEFLKNTIQELEKQQHEAKQIEISHQSIQVETNQPRSNDVEINLDKLKADIEQGFLDKQNDFKSQIDDMNVKLQKNTQNQESLEKSTEKKMANMKLFETSITNLKHDVNGLVEQVKDTAPRPEYTRRSSKVDAIEEQEAISKMRNTLFDVETSQVKMKETIDRVIKESEKKAVHIKALYDTTEKLQNDKVNSLFVEEAVNQKADKSSVESKVNRKHFDLCVDSLDQKIQDIAQKVKMQESLVNQTIGKIQADIGSKLNKDESGKLRSYVDERFKKYRPKLPEQKIQEETAAGFKKPMRNFHCISCDRPVEILQAGAIPALPYTPPLPGTKSVRPYTTFDLEQIRHHMQKGWLSSNKERFEVSQEREKLQRELLRLSGAQDFEELVASSARACGGTHTLLDAHRKAIIKSSNLYQEDHQVIQSTDNQLTETDLQGRDGHIYRGRSDELPPIKEASQNGKPSARGNSPIMARPSLQKSGSNFASSSQQTNTTKVAE